MANHELNFNILDVGSGNPSNPFIICFKRENTVRVDIDRAAFKVDVVATAEALPFKTGSFTVVHASHILEHLNNPLQSLREFRRVCRQLVIIKVPNASRMWWHEALDHRFSWNQFTLYNLLSLVFSRVEVQPSSRLTRKTLMSRLKNMVYCALFRQAELSAVCHK